MVRNETKIDHATVRKVVVDAFGSSAEADLVDALREQADPIISLVADDAGEVVGHIMFSPVTMPDHPELKLMGLAPMAVATGKQRSGIGSMLVSAGLDACGQLGAHGVVVLGHPEYYPRFGFVPSTRFGFRSEYDVPDEVFMAQELVTGSLRDCSGNVQYHAAFAAV